MKKKVLSLALALALCLGLTVPAAAEEKKLETIKDGPAQITNVLYYGSYVDAIALNAPGL